MKAKTSSSRATQALGALAPLMELYQRLRSRYGSQHWWPGETPFEVIVGAILTQACAWGNVEKAIGNLKAAASFTPQGLRQLPLEELAALIRPCGYFNVKARKIEAFLDFLGNGFNDDLDLLFAQPMPGLRERLLSVYGLGEETVDSILLYAGRIPTFVVDAYTRRILERLGWTIAGSSYGAIQRLFMENLPADEPLFNEYHALLVRHGKEVCRKRPLCSSCCLLPVCPTGQESLTWGESYTSATKRAAR